MQSSKYHFVYRAALCLLAILGGMIFLGSSQGTIQAQDGATNDIQATGTLNIVYLDPAPGSGIEPKVFISLHDDAGNKTLLLMSATQAQPYFMQRVNITGQRVSVPADASAYDSALVVNSIGAAGINIAADGVNTPSVSGSRPYLNLWCLFTDSASATPDVAKMQALLADTYPGVNHFWNQVSYTNLNLNGTTTATNAYTLPGASTSYDLGSTSDQIAQDCAAAAEGDFTFASFSGVNFFLAYPTSPGFALGGATSLNVNGGTVNKSVTWVPIQLATQTFLAHEIGHSFGLPHSGGAQGSDIGAGFPYDTWWDVMAGGGDSGKITLAVVGSVGPATISYHMDLMEWMPADRKITVATGTSQTVTLERLYQPQSTTNPLMVVVPIGGSATHFYTVEARQFSADSDYYDNALEDEGVLIHDVVPDRVLTGNGGTENIPALVMDEDNNLNVNDAGGIWKVGETYTDATNSITIEVMSTVGSTYTVKINNNDTSAPVEPSAVADSYNTPVDTVLNVNAANGVLTNDLNKGATFSAGLVNTTTNGVLNLNADGSFDYTPNSAFEGEDSFSYHLTSDGTPYNTVTVTITVGTPLSNDPSLLSVTGTTSAPVIPEFSWTHATPTSPTTAPGDWYNVKVTKGGVTVIDQWFPVAQVCIGVNCTAKPGLELYATGAYEWNVSVWTWTNAGETVGTLSGPSATANFTVSLNKAVLPNITVNVGQGRPSITFANDPNTAWLNVYTASDDFSQLLDFSWYRKDQAVCDPSTCTLLLNAHPTSNGDYVIYIAAWGPGGYSTGGVGGSEFAGPEAFSVNVGEPGEIAGVTTTNNNTGRPTFRFFGVENATWYNVELSVDGSVYSDTWFPAAENNCPTPGDYCNLTPDVVLADGTAVNWRVAAWGPGVSSLNYLSGSFTVTATGTDAPVLISPLGNTLISNPAFVWEPVEASWYHLVVEKGSTTVVDNWYPIEQVSCHLGGNCAIVVPGVFFSNGNYTFKVQGYGPAGIGSFSADQAFTVARP